MLQATAGQGAVVILPGDGPVLAGTDEAITRHPDDWLPQVLPHEFL